jgi:hypothetical protein
MNANDRPGIGDCLQRFSHEVRHDIGLAVEFLRELGTLAVWGVTDEIRGLKNEP